MSESYQLYNSVAEEAVVGAIFIDPAVIPKVFDIVKPDDFFYPQLQVIMEAVQNLYEDGKVVDLPTIVDNLHETNKFEDGVVSLLSTIIDNTINSANAVHYAKIVRKYSIRRKLYELLNRLSDEVEHGLSINEVEARLGEFFWNVRDRKENPTLGETLSQIIMNINKQDEGLRTGFESIDKYISLRKGTMTVLAARPGIGKTTFALNVALNIAKQGKKVLFVSLEMKQEELAKKLIAREAQVIGEKLDKKNVLSSDELARIVDASADISELPLVIDDTVSHDKMDVFMRIKKEMLTGCDLVIVDYLQLIANNSHLRRIDSITDISSSLKKLAMSLDIPILVLSQLNRSIEQREDKTPKLSDLRDSGAIEQDADIVLFLYTEDKETEREGLISAKVAKNRSGQTGYTKLHFLREYSTFRDWEEASNVNIK